MQTLDRRDFLKVSAAAGTVGLMHGLPAAPAQKGMRLGLILDMGRDPDKALQKVHDLGIPTCQVSTEDLSDAMLEGIREAVRKFNLEVTALNTSGPGPQIYDFYQGPLTIGLVPRQYRPQRIAHLKQASDFAKKLGFPALHTHFGFIPENPNDPLYKETLEALREVATHLKANGQMMLYETGQETPITLLRAITDVGLDNQFVNLDTANLILYGKGNPLDALDVIGKLVRGIHAKDGLFPTDPKNLGEEVPIGQGKANFPMLIPRLKELGYDGPLTIEREISGPRQIDDIRKEKQYLEKLIG
ncbi:MAG: TIM barrel protein [Terriglobia bacterium]|jgi:sugar phosphate isomerase/epimerase